MLTRNNVYKNMKISAVSLVLTISFLMRQSSQDLFDEFCKHDRKVTSKFKDDISDLHQNLIEESNQGFFERSSSNLSQSGYSKKYYLTPENREIIEHELQLNTKLMLKKQKPVPDLISCNIDSEDVDGNTSIVVLNFDAFYDITTEYFRTKVYTKPLSYRMKVYTSAARSLAEIHKNEIVHCNILPVNVGSASLNCNTLRFKDLSSAISLEGDDVRACRRNVNFPNPKDLFEDKCRTKDAAKKADIWSLGLVLLQIELDINSIANSVFLGDEFMKQKSCFSGEWTNDCNVRLNDFIEQMELTINRRNPFEKKLAGSFRDLISRMVDDCEKRPSAEELFQEMGQLAFKDDFSSYESSRQSAKLGLFARLCRALCGAPTIINI